MPVMALSDPTNRRIIAINGLSGAKDAMSEVCRNLRVSAGLFFMANQIIQQVSFQNDLVMYYSLFFSEISASK